MTTLRRSILPAVSGVALFLLAPGRGGAPAAEQPDPKMISYTLPENIQWRKTEAQDSATLQGDPSKPGVYVQLLRWHAGHNSRPHMHSTDRYIYVLSGTWYMGWGNKYNYDGMFPVSQGTFVIHHANQPHYDGAKEADCLLYIVGTGPMTTQQTEEK